MSVPTAFDAHPAPLFAEAAGDVELSFEFFPPRSDAAVATLLATAHNLAPLSPRFVSVTYGAGGSSRNLTQDVIMRIAQETGVSAAAHLTCVGASRAEVDEVADRFWQAGIRHIVALRGDMPEPHLPYVPHDDGYENAAALVTGLKRLHPFEISVAAYPEHHPDSADPTADLDNLWRKVDAGADRALTQFFFSPDTFFRFRDQAAARGIDVEIVPGILPIANVAQLRRFAGMCGASIPPWIERVLDGLDERPAARQLVAMTIAAELCAALYAGGVRQFHFYTLNRAELTWALCHLLGVRAADLPPEASQK